MPFSKKNRANTLSGVLLVALFSVAALHIAQTPQVAGLGISPLIIGIILGMFYANTLRNNLPQAWVPGIVFSGKRILRAAIILYGFHITFQQIAAVGAAGLGVSVIMLTSTFLLGTWVGMKVFKLDRDTAMLTASGSSVCGAAAVLATEPVLNARPYKSAIAVGTVVLFGTMAMFVYPALYSAGFFDMAPGVYGIYVGGTIHEVAQVVAAANATPGAVDNAVIVKMVRVMMIAPMLVILGLCISKKAAPGERRIPLVIPWFAVWFIIVSGLNSLHLLPSRLVGAIIDMDTFMLTMAMTALGMETSFKKFKEVGPAPFYQSLVMFAWLMIGGYLVTKAIVAVF